MTLQDGQSVIVRILIGLVIAGCVSLAARRARSLSRGGAAAATALGTLAMAAGYSWAALLITYFVVSTTLSQVRRAQKESRTGSVVVKGGERDAIQVLANGAGFGVAALLMLAQPDVRWMALGAGSLAASAADTWATEIGTLAKSDPRSILTWRRVPTGTSGGVSLVGTIAMLLGGAFMGLVAIIAGWPAEVGMAAVVGGIAGAIVDSLIGATLQARRWCDTCNRETERSHHDCGSATRPLRGLAWMDNDIVNFVSAAAGGVLAALLTH